MAGNDIARTAPLAALALLAAGMSHSQPSGSTPHLDSTRTVALSGQQALGLPNGVNYFGFVNTKISNTGAVAFQALLLGGNQASPFGIMREDESLTLGPVALSGTQAPGLPMGVTFPNLQPFPDLNMSKSGNIAFLASLIVGATGSPNTRAIFADRVGSGFSAAARVGDQASGFAPDITFKNFNAISANDTGELAFYGTLAGPGINVANQDVIYRQLSSGDLLPLAREMEQVPGDTPGTLWKSFNIHTDINNGGRVAFNATLTDELGTESFGLFSASIRNDMIAHAKSGNQAPGLTAGVAMTGFSDAVLNNNNQVAFYSGLEGSGVTSSNNLALFGPGDSGLTFIAREGDQVLSQPNGVLYDFDMSLPLILNDQSGLALYTRLRGTTVTSSTNTAIVSTGSGTELSVVARTGDQVPGLADGTVFIDISGGTLEMNNTGQVAFRAGWKMSQTISYGLFATSPSGELVLVASPGQSIDVNNDPLITDERIISAVNSDFGFNDLGQIAFNVQFTDGSLGVFVRTIPTPSTLPLVACIGFALRRRRSAK